MNLRSRLIFPLSVAFLLCCAHVAFGETAPCALLTKDEVTSIVGASVGAGSPIANTGCSWTTTGGPRVVVTISLQSERMFNAAKSSNMPQTTKSPVSGLGDEAVFIGMQGFSSLWMRKGTKFPLLRIYGVAVSDAQTKLKALAADALSKL